MQIKKHSLYEKCPSTEFFLVRIFPVFSPNTGKYGPEKTLYLNIFRVVILKLEKRQYDIAIPIQ